MTRDLDLVEPEALLFWAGWELLSAPPPAPRADLAVSLFDPLSDHLSGNSPTEPQPLLRLW
jgi:hypothetical protein